MGSFRQNRVSITGYQGALNAACQQPYMQPSLVMHGSRRQRYKMPDSIEIRFKTQFQALAFIASQKLPSSRQGAGCIKHQGSLQMNGNSALTARHQGRNSRFDEGGETLAYSRREVDCSIRWSSYRGSLLISYGLACQSLLLLQGFCMCPGPCHICNV